MKDGTPGFISDGGLVRRNLPKGETADKPKEEPKEPTIPEDDYKGLHTSPGPDGGAPLYDLTGGGTIYPDDVYSPQALRYYGTGDDKLDRETFGILNRLKGNPEADVKVYRAVPKGVTSKINPGDWVTVNKNYAIDHGSRFDGGFDILEVTAKAKDLFTNGDSIHEQGYHPNSIKHAEDVSLFAATWTPHQLKDGTMGYKSEGGLVRRTLPKGATAGKAKPTSDKPQVSPSPSKSVPKPAQSASQAAVTKAIQSPKSLSKDELDALPGHLKNMTVPQLKAIESGIAKKGVKAQLIANIENHVRAKVQEGGTVLKTKPKAKVAPKVTAPAKPKANDAQVKAIGENVVSAFERARSIPLSQATKALADLEAAKPTKAQLLPIAKSVNEFRTNLSAPALLDSIRNIVLTRIGDRERGDQ